MKHNPTHKVLGVTLDEKLKFNVHTQPLEKKACNTMTLLRKVIATDLLNIKSVLQFYKALVAPWPQ